MRMLRWWYKGPGLILIIVGGIITVAYIVHKDREKKEAEASTHETQRQMGSVNPTDSVDKAHAQKKQAARRGCLRVGHHVLRGLIQSAMSGSLRPLTRCADGACASQRSRAIRPTVPQQSTRSSSARVCCR